MESGSQDAGASSENDVSQSEQTTVEHSRTLPHRLSSARGSALDFVLGPFYLANTGVKVLPLLADPAKLNQVCGDFLSTDNSRFEAWGRYVFMTATRLEDWASANENISEWSEARIDFQIPLKWYDAGGDLLSVGVFSPFIFTNSAIAAATGREVAGNQISQGRIQSPATNWLASASGEGTTQLLRFVASVLPSIAPGETLVDRTILEVVLHQTPVQDLPAVPIERKAICRRWERALRDQLDSLARHASSESEQPRQLSDLATAMLDDRRPFNYLSFKQFEDAVEPERACYQALVRSGFVIERLAELKRLGQPGDTSLQVHIPRYATFPITETLGLVCSDYRIEDGQVIDTVTPINPFRLTMDTTSIQSRNIAHRAGSTVWEPRTKDGRATFKDVEFAFANGQNTEARQLIESHEPLEIAEHLLGAMFHNPARHPLQLRPPETS